MNEIANKINERIEEWQPGESNVFTVEFDPHTWLSKIEEATEEYGGCEIDEANYTFYVEVSLVVLEERFNRRKQEWTREKELENEGFWRDVV